jgi:hypothetical protein
MQISLALVDLPEALETANLAVDAGVLRAALWVDSLRGNAACWELD